MKANATVANYNVVQALKGSDINGNLLVLPKIDSKTYRDVDDVLNRLGGKWDRRAKGHVFDACPRAKINEIVETWRIPARNAEAFFPTPPAVVDVLVRNVEAWLRNRSADGPLKFLEPSAGDGAIAARIDGLISSCSHETTLVEVNAGRAQSCRDKISCARVIEGDFLTVELPPQDLIVANPPFSVPSDKLAWVTHTARMASLVAPGGLLCVVLPSAYEHRKLKKLQELQRRLDSWEEYEVESLPQGSFSESGTEVATVIVSAVRSD